MQKPLTTFFLAPLALGALPLLWFACTAPTAGSSPTVAMATPVPPRLDPEFHSTVHPFVETYCVS